MLDATYHSSWSAPSRTNNLPALPDDSGQSGLSLQMFPIVILVKTIVTANLIGQNNSINP